MGSWNKTCGLSNLHIYAGSEAYGFPLIRVAESERCYASAMWRPVLLPFTCEYDDFGGGENCSANLAVILDAMRDRIVEVPQGESIRREMAITQAELNEKLFFEAIWANRLHYNDAMGSMAPVDCVLFRKDIVDMILTEYTINKYVGKGNGDNGSAYIDIKFTDVASEAPVYASDRRDFLKREIIKDPVMGKYRLLTHQGSFSECSFGYYIETYKDHRHWLSHNIIEVVDDLLLDDRFEEAVRILTDMCRGVFIEIFMNDTRHHWTPMSFEGCQSSELEPHRLLCNAITAALDEEKDLIDSLDDD